MTQPATPHQPAPARRQPPALVLWAGLTAGLAVILVALLALFIFPALKSGPHDLAIGVVGSAQQQAAVGDGLQAHAPGAFAVTEFDSSQDLDDAVRDRTVAGGVDLSGDTVRSVIASAGSTAISATIASAGDAIAAGLGVTAETADIVALPESDPTGIGIGGLAFPLVFGGIVPAVAFRAVLSGRRGWIFSGLVGFSAVGGVIVAAMLRFVFGSIEHSFWPVAGAVALGIAALAIPLAALNECFGTPAFTAVAMLMMFVGNPFAGISTSAAWLPAGVAVIGQALPPGAAGTLVRAAAYFDGAGGAAAAVTLAVWVVVGTALWLAAPAIRRRREKGQHAVAVA